MTTADKEREELKWNMCAAWDVDSIRTNDILVSMHDMMLLLEAMLPEPAEPCKAEPFPEDMKEVVTRESKDELLPCPHCGRVQVLAFLRALKKGGGRGKKKIRGSSKTFKQSHQGQEKERSEVQLFFCKPFSLRGK
jgi:hypothetical protein